MLGFAVFAGEAADATPATVPRTASSATIGVSRFNIGVFLPCSLEGRTHSGRSIRAFSRRDNGRDPISGTATYKVLTLAPVTHLLATYGLVVLFFAIAIESAGVPIPGETALITAAVFASTNQHHFSIVWVVVVAAAGAIIGDNVGYILGRIGGRRLVEKIAPLRKELPRGERFFEKHGGKTVFFGCFVAFLRITSAWLAGITKMHWAVFFAWNAAGGIVWAAAIGVTAY